MKSKNPEFGLTDDEKFWLGQHFGLKLLVAALDKYKNYKNLFISTGIDKRHFHKLVNGEISPTLQTIFSYSKALNINPKDLIDFDLGEKIILPGFGGLLYYYEYVKRNGAKLKPEQ